MVEFALSNCQSVKLTGRTMKISEFGDLCGILLGRSAVIKHHHHGHHIIMFISNKQTYSAGLKIAG